jgi:TPR repeat protein
MYNNFSVIYQNGVGVAKNETRAFEYFNRSAALGNGWGMNSLASCYVYGHGVAPNRTRGIELWHQAAAKGNTAAHTNLGMLYREGHGPCPPYCRDYSAAYYHLDQATPKSQT